MLISPDELMPNGYTFGYTNMKHMIAEPIHLIYKDLYYLRYNLQSWLSLAIKIIIKHKRPLQNFIFDEDLIRLKKILHNKGLKKFHHTIREITKENIISPSHLPDLKNLLNTSTFKETYDRVEIHELTRWLLVNDDKIKTFKNNEIYAPFPETFNDIFDCQLRLNENTIENLSKIFNMSKKQIDYYQDFFNSANICCFSSLDPLSTLSNHMWGLYANHGIGIAIQYKIDKLIEKISPNMPRAYDNFVYALGIGQENRVPVDPSKFDNCRILAVEYSQENNKLEWFKKYLSCITTDPTGVRKTEKFITNFLTAKSIEWRFEKEIRLVSLDFIMTNAPNINHPIHMDYYMRNTEASLHVHQSKENFSKSIPFIKPDKIIFGWDFIERFPQYYQKLELLCDEKFQLLKTVDYINERFSYALC